MLQEIWSSLRDAAKERITNPLVGSFVVFVAACNWKVLACLFLATGDIETRMKLVETHSAAGATTLLRAAVAAIVYVVAMPVIVLGVKWWQLKWTQRSKKALLSAELDLVRSRLELADLEAQVSLAKARPSVEAKKAEYEHEMSKVRAQHDVVVADLQAQVSALQAQLAAERNDNRRAGSS